MSDATNQDSPAARVPKPRRAADPRLEPAVALENAGDTAGAERAYQAEISADPTFGAAYAALGSMYVRLRRYADAIAMLKEAVRLLPTNPSPLGNLSMACMRSGRAAEACEHAKRLVQLTPKVMSSYVLLADCQYAAKNMAGIVDAYTAGHKELPESHELLMLLIRALINANKNERAERTLEAAFAKIAPTPTLQGLLGDAQFRQGKINEADATLQRALEADPKCQVALAALAKIRVAQDRNDEAGVLLDQLTPPIDPPAMVTLASVRRRQKRNEEAERLLEEVIARPVERAEAVAPAQFLLGSIREGQERYDEAFALYKSANEASIARFDREAVSTFVNNVIDVFNAWKAPAYARGDPTDVPIFIIGMPRSGTSLVEQILASHPEVYAAGELSDMEMIANRTCRRLGITPRPYPLYLPSLTPQQAVAAGRPYLERIHATAPNARRFTDKMPHNFRHVGLIWQLFPNARIIHCRRDPIDTCLSCYSISFNASHAYSNRLEDLAFMYGEYRRLMQHWRSSLPFNMIEVVYEELVHSPEEGSRRIVDFAGLEWNDNCLNFHKTKRAVLTASVDQVRRPVYDSSISRWKRFETHLRPLIDAMGDLAHVPG